MSDDRWENSLKFEICRHGSIEAISLFFFEFSTNMAANYEGTVYAVVTPILDGGDGTGWAFLGETDKYVTASSRRFTKVQGWILG